MIGITLFYQPISRALLKRLPEKCPRPVLFCMEWLAKGIALCLCCDFAITPLVIKYWGYFSVLSLLSNLFLLPILVLCFQASVVAYLFRAWFVLFPFGYLLTALRAILSWSAEIPFAFLNVQNGGLWFLAYFIGAIASSRFILIHRRYKIAVAMVFFSIYALGFIL
jgi:hypothetical protein